MSLRREQNAELERVYNDFMNYYQKKGLMPKHNHNLKYPCYDQDHDGDCDNNEYHHKHKHHTKPMPKPIYPPHHNHHPHPIHPIYPIHPHHPMPYEPPMYELPYTILPFPLYPNIPYSPLNQKRVIEDNSEYTIRQSERATKVLEPAKVCDPNETFPVVYTPDILNATPRVDNSKTVEQKYYKAMFSDISKTLQPYVDQVIKNNNYEGSPINDKYFDRESLAQLVQEVLDRAKNNPKLVSYIQNLDPKVREIMKNLVEALVLGDLFVVHRPNTKLNESNMMNIMPYNSQNARYNNIYGDPKNSKPLDENMDNYLCEPCMQGNTNGNMNVMPKPLMENYENKVQNKSRNPLFNETQNFSN